MAMQESNVSAVETGTTMTLMQKVAARVRDFTHGTSEASITNRAATTVFIIRVISAGLAYASQIVLARWMGASEYGIYVYIWTWVLMLGSLLDFGMSPAAQKVIPEYRVHGNFDSLRGFLAGARWMVFAGCCAICVLLACAIYLAAPKLPQAMVVPFYLALLTLPAFVVANIQDAMARAWDWMRLGLMPTYIVRQGLLIALTGGALLIGFKLDATAAMIASAIAVWIAMLCQLVPLNRRLATVVPEGPRRYEGRSWFATSLPIVLTESTFMLLTYTDVLLLQQFRPSEEVGVYFAVVKTLVLVSFIHYAIGAATAHRFTEFHASGDKKRLEEYVAHSIKVMFWPSLAATILLLIFGKPMLWLFGPQFVEGYGMMFVMAVGLIVRAAVGPVERLLNMLGLQHVCAVAYGLAFLCNAALCLVLIPRYGGYGAAAALSIALIFLTGLLFYIAKTRLGLHVLPFGRRKD